MRLGNDAIATHAVHQALVKKRSDGTSDRESLTVWRPRLAEYICSKYQLKNAFR